MTLSSFLSYFLILFIATISPGPSMLLAMNHGLNHGLARTMYSCLGNVAGNVLMAFVSILGLGAVLVASGTLFNSVKLIGVAYLVVAGLQLFFKKERTGGSDLPRAIVRENAKRSHLSAQGFFIALSNPKGILFFTALFPQFIRSNSVTNYSIIISTLALVAFVCYMAYALFGQRLNGFFRVYAFKKAFNRLAGSFFIATGLALACSKK